MQLSKVRVVDSQYPESEQVALAVGFHCSDSIITLKQSILVLA
jgi:hypothetical protein